MKSKSAAAAALCETAEAAGGEWDARKKAFVFQRYCHVYAQGDLRKLFLPLARWVVSTPPRASSSSSSLPRTLTRFLAPLDVSTVCCLLSDVSHSLPCAE